MKCVIKPFAVILLMKICQWPMMVCHHRIEAFSSCQLFWQWQISVEELHIILVFFTGQCCHRTNIYCARVYQVRNARENWLHDYWWNKFLFYIVPAYNFSFIHHENFLWVKAKVERKFFWSKWLVLQFSFTEVLHSQLVTKDAVFLSYTRACGSMEITM